MYSKPPFGGPEQVLDYLGRYTHRVAISNNRLLGLHDDKVTFRWRDYKNGNQLKMMTLDAQEFIRRFLLHVLPRGFVRIRHYGILSNPRRKQNLAICRLLLDAKQDLVPEPVPTENWMQRYESLTGESVTLCPVCHRGRMLWVEHIESCYNSRKQPEGIDSS